MELFDSLQSNLRPFIGRQIVLIRGDRFVSGKLENAIIYAHGSAVLHVKGEEHLLSNVDVRRLDVREHILTFEDGTVLRLPTPADAVPGALAGQASPSAKDEASLGGKMVRPGQRLPDDGGSYHPS